MMNLEKYRAYLEKRGVPEDYTDDIIQDTVEYMLEAGTFGNETYFYQTLNSRMKDWYRRAKLENRIFQQLQDEDGATQGVETSQLTEEELHRCIERIEELENETHKEVLERYFFSGETYTEISEDMDMNYNTTKNLVQRFREKLKEV